MSTFKDFRIDIKPNWCPGCGDYSVLTAIQKAAANIGLEPENMAVVSGIGCSGRISGYIKSYGFHSIHGRALPIAQGVKMANRDLTVLAAGGDGDGFAIGTNHTIHAIRRNIDITYVVMDNHIYGLTKGQTSPLSSFGAKTKSTPLGSIEQPIRPLELAISAGAGFVAQGFAGNLAQLTKIIEEGIKHKGFSFINVFSPCIAFNKFNTYDWFKERIVNLDEDQNFDNSNRVLAVQKVMEHDSLVTGIVYRDPERESYENLVPNFKQEPLVKQNMSISREDFTDLLREFE
ncbi:2-oxoacid ferredoxin oxidoreductase [Vulcanibacillus modesticaldus]|uniref:2-oxoacid ferredoxin oxidoreductase n=1 Tax=Vulcanibacillus modesticaldus TaxID=337097 RepID=A0A1D2YXS7_9BACI|nr:2-oxoacid:ferredoxin oxidoreductase subunit beta [Vulcanibacillus modesticaldus]OEG00480.1 2-oxoacid ferredoxin oxidoreductase [Vulcanibacillus modesticaldus]